MKALFYLYTPDFLKTIVYMLQSTEYRIGDYIAWLLRTADFRKVQQRRSLTYTHKALLLLGFAVVLVAVCWSIGLMLIIMNFNSNLWWFAGVGIIVSFPFIVMWGIVIPLIVGEKLIQKPREKKIIESAQKTLENHQGYRIAIAGSFGKTSFKEMLNTVLTAKLHVAASPGNMNTPIGLSRFIKKLDGSEDVLVFELGEEKIGDVMRLCKLTQPNCGVITGISEAHLSSFGNLKNAIKTVFELRDFLGNNKLYANGENAHITSELGDDYQLLYTKKGINGWTAKNIDVSLEGMMFEVTKNNRTFQLHSRLIGEHQIGPMLACIDIADSLGLSTEEIIEGIEHTKPFEHRMQPYQLAGATIIDDTYNGNIKGIEAGIGLLSSIEATRKIYVTPGLVDQGSDSAAIHQRIGEMIAPIFDIVVLMKNSTTNDIENGLKLAGYNGQVIIIDNPLSFYTNLQHFVAKGDVVLMQNDWTDNYA